LVVEDRNRIHKPMLMWTTLATLVATQLQWVVAPHHTAIAVLVVTAALFSAPVRNPSPSAVRPIEF
jgi:hypothetical protein